jgi:hypothetical protein
LGVGVKSSFRERNFEVLLKLQEEEEEETEEMKAEKLKEKPQKTRPKKVTGNLVNKSRVRLQR